jgi:choline-sulfatase
MLLTALALALAGPPNVVLVTVDTLRADALHVYGNARIATPGTDRMAREGVVMEDATVQSPLTRPSHTSILTGRYPWEHGARDNVKTSLRGGVPTLAGLLRERGYRTAAFLGSYVLGSTSGLNKGFDLYDAPLSREGRRGSVRSRSERPAFEVTRRALEWVSGEASNPFFAWVHLYDPHAPYTPPPPHDKTNTEHPYFGEVAYADEQVGRILDFLDEHGLRSRTLVVVTSDHGEALGAHGETEHAFFLYDTTLRVPLLMSLPGVLPAGRRITGQFRSVDLLPTIMALIGQAAPAVSGTSRAGELRSGGRLPANESLSETLFGAIHFGTAPVLALRSETWKLIDTPRPELYALGADRQETANLADREPQVVARMREQLRASGAGSMLGSGLPSAARAPSTLDPKGSSQTYEEHREEARSLRTLVNAGRLDEALAILDVLHRVGIASFDEHRTRASLSFKKRRYEQAMASLEAALEMQPGVDEVYVELARAHLALGQAEEARRALGRGLAIEPTSSLLLTAQAGLLQRLGDLRGALRVLEGARATAPADARLRVQLGDVYRALGDFEHAREELKAATRLEPSSVQAWTDYGEVLVAGGQKREAMAAFRVVLKLDARAGRALLGLAALQLAEDPDAALQLLQRLVALDPGYPGVGDALRAARAAKAAKAGASPSR